MAAQGPLRAQAAPAAALHRRQGACPPAPARQHGPVLLRQEKRPPMTRRHGSSARRKAPGAACAWPHCCLAVSLPVAHRPLPVARCPLPVARCPLPVARCPSPIAHRPSPIAHRPSPIAHRPSPCHLRASCKPPCRRACGLKNCPQRMGPPQPPAPRRRGPSSAQATALRGGGKGLHPASATAACAGPASAAANCRQLSLTAAVHPRQWRPQPPQPRRRRRHPGIQAS